jgi:tetratricopeptide (TPR) repeat protein
MASTGRYPAAIERLSTALKSEPDYVEARLLLADLLRQSGRPDDSLRHYARVIEINPRVAEARLGEALALVVKEQYQQARDRLVDATTVFPGHPDLVQALARILSASPDPRARDGRRALAMAEELVKRQPTPEGIEALAMAYAESADYQQAVAWQQKAISAAEQAGRNPHIGKQMAENLSMFQRGEPCRIPWRVGVGTMP